MSEDHTHDFVYQGVQYAHGDFNRPGSGAKQRYYSHVYYCRSCLEKRYEPICDIDECSYQEVRFSAAPGDRLTLVPEHDRARY